MANEKKVVVQGGGDNLYRIKVYNGRHYVQKANGGLLSTSYRDIGQTRSLDDALSIIRSHSGQEIKSIS